MYSSLLYLPMLLSKYAADDNALSHVKVGRGDGYRKLKLYLFDAGII